MKAKKIITTMISLCMATSILVGCNQPTKKVNIDFNAVYGSDTNLKTIAKQLINEKSPEIDNLKDITGNKINLSNIKKKTVLEFISTKSSAWEVCLDAIEQNKKKYPDIQFIQFYLDEDKSMIINSLKEKGITDYSGIISCDDNTLLPSTILETYNIVNYPTFILINETGTLTYYDVGQINSSLLEQFINTYLS